MNMEQATRQVDHPLSLFSEAAQRVFSIAYACAGTGRALRRDHLEIIRKSLGVSDEEMRAVNNWVAEAICAQIREEYREEL